jgi:adenylate cyclase
VAQNMAKVLIVDDTPELREILAMRVEALGHQVVTAMNGREALDILAMEPVDLVLLDVMMPELTGYQVLEIMKADANLRHIPVIVISAVSELDSIVRCIQLGAEDYLPKPFNAVLLKARLQASLERKRLRDQEQALLEAIDQERMRAERLLLNILPEPIGERLKAGERVIANYYESATVLFADLVGFTGMTAYSSPEQLVSTLNDVFSLFDSIADRFGVEKIKTIGDGVMLVGGVPIPRPDHAFAVANAALALLQEVGQYRWNDHNPMNVRIGIHSGPVVAGVIGTKKFSYDLWGDTVNVASRMESLGETGRIQVSEATYKILKGGFEFEKRGPISIKGREDVCAYFLVRPVSLISGQ